MAYTQWKENFSPTSYTALLTNLLSFHFNFSSFHFLFFGPFDITYFWFLRFFFPPQIIPQIFASFGLSMTVDIQVFMILSPLSAINKLQVSRSVMSVSLWPQGW